MIVVHDESRAAEQARVAAQAVLANIESLVAGGLTAVDRGRLTRVCIALSAARGSHIAGSSTRSMADELRGILTPLRGLTARTIVGWLDEARALDPAGRDASPLHSRGRRVRHSMPPPDLANQHHAGPPEPLETSHHDGRPERRSVDNPSRPSRGEHGAVAVIGECPVAAPTHPVTVVDEVGAGDAFVGGHLSRVVHSASVAEALEVANLVGGIVCGSPGDWEALPTAEELTAARCSRPAAACVRR